MKKSKASGSTAQRHIEFMYFFCATPTMSDDVGVQPGRYHFATLGEQDALAEGGFLVLVSVPGPLRVRFQRRSH